MKEKIFSFVGYTTFPEKLHHGANIHRRFNPTFDKNWSLSMFTTLQFSRIPSIVQVSLHEMKISSSSFELYRKCLDLFPISRSYTWLFEPCFPFYQKIPRSENQCCTNPRFKAFHDSAAQSRSELETDLKLSSGLLSWGFSDRTSRTGRG